MSFSSGVGVRAIDSSQDQYKVYAGPMPNSLGVARTYHFPTESAARLFAEHTKAAAWADHGVDRKVTIEFPGGFKVAVTLEE